MPRPYDSPPRSAARIPAWVLIVFLAVGVVIAGGVALAAWLLATQSGDATRPREVTPAGERDPEEREAIDLFKNAKDSVVNVDTVVFRRGFNQPVEAVQAGTGSGFVWDDDGHVVTNYHVIRQALEAKLALRVVLSDRTEWKCEVVGVAPDYDLAVLRINARGGQLKKIRVGTSGDLEVGQKVYAIGNPFGLSLTLTKGIISALDREIESATSQPISGVIQTDAPINPGNSGGPLLDRDGRLIGVNTAIATGGVKGGGNIGIGFAIPVDTVNSVVPMLIRDGRMRKSDLGVKLVEQTRLRRSGYTNGVMLAQVETGSPAATAGLRGLRQDPRTGEVLAGDMILKVDGVEVKDNAAFERLVRKHAPGEQVTLTIQRDEKVSEVTITLAGV